MDSNKTSTTKVFVVHGVGPFNQEGTVDQVTKVGERHQVAMTDRLSSMPGRGYMIIYTVIDQFPKT